MNDASTVPGLAGFYLSGKMTANPTGTYVESSLEIMCVGGNQREGETSRRFEA